MNWFRLFRSCSHQFNISNIEKTNIEPLEEPSYNNYQAWCKYYKEVYTHDSVTKRIKCSCDKCGKTFYAQCGLDLPGKLIQTL